VSVCVSLFLSLSLSLSLCERSWSIVRHPSTGQNLLMSGADLLEAPTGTSVAQRSEAGQGILGVKEGKGMWVWSAVLLAVLSSRMSAGGCPLAGCRDNVSSVLFWRQRRQVRLLLKVGNTRAS
jgi:hypothetical protein